MARKWASDQEAAIRGGSYIEPKTGKVTLADLYEELHVARPTLRQPSDCTAPCGGTQ